MPFNYFTIKKNEFNQKNFLINVKTIDAEMSFNLDIKLKGIDLFELVCRALGIRETWYFGLLYTDPFNNRFWLKMKKKIKHQCPTKDKQLNFDFLIKFYPEDVTEEIIQSMTRHAFFLQVKQAILNTEIYCPPEATVLLASYAIQAKYGDYSKEIINSKILSTEELLPQKVVNQFQMTADMWMEQILEWYFKIRGMEREDAETEYLKIAQDLEMFSVQYFKITNNQSTNLWLGVTNHGLNIYEHDNKLQPKISFQWNEIRGLTFRDKKFIVNLMDKKSPKFVCFVDREKTCKTIMDLCIGNHELYLRRRRPDTMEVQQMKSQTKDEKLKRQAEHERLLHERNEVVRKIKQEQDEKIEIHNKYVEMQQQLITYQEALSRSEEAAGLLAEKVQLAEEEVLLLRQKANEALNEKNMILLETNEEKLIMEKKLKEAELFAESLFDEINKKSNEAQKLQYELAETRKAELETRKTYTSIIQSHVLNEENFVNLIPTTIENIEVSKSEYLFQNSSCLQKEIDKPQIKDTRLTELKNDVLQPKLTVENPLDNIFEQNHQLGENKYSTLEKVRGGTAKYRVQAYEQL